ncbi:restriction endonuclease subunit S [Gallibacterium sp. AGMB14963]|nr:restriction endonuclease subunit S [Gallibacterium sp. AGMB14963]MDA3978702.1 restriction endonuclease subunit S [Gallibacterium sp. AGMB14963]
MSFFGSASDGVRIGQWDLSKTRMKEIPFIIPPLAEQQQIADYLEQKSAEIDATIAHYEQQIDKLKEYKTVLIQAAVTGQIEVSNDG